MNAKKCDFCGGFFIPNVARGRSIKIESGYNWDKLDVCQSCLHDVFKLISDEELRDQLTKRYCDKIDTTRDAGDGKV